MNFSTSNMQAIIGDLMFLMLVSTVISWLVFANCSMRVIEKKMRAADMENLREWDGPGWRVAWYAWAIFLPICWCNNAKDPVLNPVVVKKYATRKDWVLAGWFFISGHAFVLLAFLY